MCHFENIHNNHRLLRSSDEDSLKKEDISIEESTKDWNETKKAIEELKNKIENEMIKLDKLYENVDKEITKSFKLKYEQLTKEENELKDKLKNEVTKIKEKLEINITNINEILRINERITKGLQIFLEEKEQPMIKKLNYISNINKNQKEMKLMFQEYMKNINITFNKNENNIKYE